MAAVSVITPLLNRADMLPRALDSVAAQNTIVEHIVVDGGSIDGSQEIARAGGARVFDLPGSSIYEALNFGIDRSAGDILCLLNSDDRLAPGAIKSAQTAFDTDSALELVRGRVGVEDAARDYEEENQARALTLYNVLLHASNINACFFSRDLWRRVGPFESQYPISADRKWLARALVTPARSATLNTLVYVYRRHAGSLTIGHDKPATRQWINEHLAWSQAMLADSALSPEARSALRTFRAKESTHLAFLDLRRGAISEAFGTIAGGFSRDALWPLRAAAPVSAIAARRANYALRRLRK